MFTVCVADPYLTIEKLVTAVLVVTWKVVPTWTAVFEMVEITGRVAGAPVVGLKRYEGEYICAYICINI